LKVLTYKRHGLDGFGGSQDGGKKKTKRPNTRKRQGKKCETIAGGDGVAKIWADLGV